MILKQIGGGSRSCGDRDPQSCWFSSFLPSEEAKRIDAMITEAMLV